MPTLYVRDFPRELHDQLEQKAAQNHRSVGAEVAELVRRGLERDSLTRQRVEALRGLDELRDQWKLPPGAVDSATLIREDRDR